MTVQEIIQRVQILSSDTDPSGHTNPWFLAILDNFAKDLYDFVMKWKLQNVNGFNRTKLVVSVDSEGKYALPANFATTSEIWLTGETKPIGGTSYPQLNSTSTYSTKNAWSIYNNYWYIKPVPTSTVEIYYYPKWTALTLSTTWPGNGLLDNVAIELMYSKLLADDRESKYDVTLDVGFYSSALLRAKKTMIGSEPKVILPNVANWK